MRGRLASPLLREILGAVVLIGAIGLVISLEFRF
jgi:hypothetical protein